MTPRDLLEDEEFGEITREALLKVFALLFKKGMPFGVITNVSKVRFEPPLPENVRKKFQPLTLFALDGYTLSTVKLNDGTLSFEAGFGEGDFASLVSVPTGAILQIIIGDTPVFLNMAIETTQTKQPNKPKRESRESMLKKSMDALLSNPENENLFKK